ncbi:MAG: hypothetical protein ACOYU3_10210 [Bacillota bacterium]
MVSGTNDKLLLEYDYFKNHFEEIRSNFFGKHIAIKNSVILGSYDSYQEAIEQTCKTEEIGTFLVQEVVKNISDLYHVYHTRVN